MTDGKQEKLMLHVGTPIHENMRSLNSRNPENRLTPLRGLIAVLCASPLFFYFAFNGDPARGRAAMLCGAVGLIAIECHWEKRKYVWFWVTVAILAVLHLPLVLFVRWQQQSYPGYTLLPFAILEFALVYGCIKLVAKVIIRSQSPDA